jgi:hypothetical protein
MENNEKLLDSLGSKYAGQYLINQFFIRIFTGKTKSEIGSYDYENHTFSEADQLWLQGLNFPALYHEHLHYVHEMSTVAGIWGFIYNIIDLSIFCEYVDVPDSSGFKGIGPAHAELHRKVSNSIRAFNGGMPSDLEDIIITEIISIGEITFDAFMVDGEDMAQKIPLVVFKYTDRNRKTFDSSLLLNKYYLYEGLAHELDQLVEIRKNPQHKSRGVSSEYRVLRLVGQYLNQNIEDRQLLEIASLSLNNWDCGNWFVQMVVKLKEAVDKDTFMQQLKSAVGMQITESIPEVNFHLDYMKKAVANRVVISAAVNHMVVIMEQALQRRAASPTFEIDVSFSGHFDLLNKYVPICDYMYVLEDTDTYMKDFLGTHLTPLLSFDLKIFLCFMDYYFSMASNNKEHSCPLNSCCNFEFRKQNAAVCARDPKLAFDLHNPQHDRCPYFFGVAYTRGHNP